MKKASLELIALLVLIVLIGLNALVAASCVVTRSVRSDTPAGTTHASYESYAGGLVVRSDEVTRSRPDYRACLEDRRLQARESGRMLGVDDQVTCYSQVTGGAPLVGTPSVVTVPTYSSPYGYGYPYGGYGGYGSPYGGYGSPYGGGYGYSPYGYSYGAPYGYSYGAPRW